MPSATLRAPGVYFEPRDLRPRFPGLARTDIAGFVGISARGPVHQPTRIESINQFHSIFGGRIPQAFLAYSVEAFFRNGGRTCWIVRVADPNTIRPASATLLDWRGQPTLKLTALDPGTGGQSIRYVLTHDGRERFSLIVKLGDDVTERWDDLSLLPTDQRYVVSLINGDSAGGTADNPERTQSRLIRVDALTNSSWYPESVPATSPHASVDGATGTSVLRGALEGGADGLSTLTIDHLTGHNSLTGEYRGLRALEHTDEVSIVAMPDMMSTEQYEVRIRPVRDECGRLVPSTRSRSDMEREYPPVFTREQILHLQRELITHCARMQDRFAILDVPRVLNDSEISREQVADWRREFQSAAARYAALYYPWVVERDLTHPEDFRSVPACGLIAGVYARSDLSSGVHKSPANERLELNGDALRPIDEDLHAWLNEHSVNVIRAYPGRGLRVAGARTLAGRDEMRWRFISVRRLVTAIEEALAKWGRTLVFEPNSNRLWVEIDRSVRGLLTRLWDQGLLDGATPDEAFTVACDDTVNPATETDNGRVLCDIRLRPPFPAEMIFLRLGQTGTGISISEVTEGESSAPQA